ncbi:MAG: peptidoglycan editing factor PgeF [Ignavibacteriae bacterium]|nr:peptidoglycan editing factor PgeF [Ignavibacteriota bacterium]
MFEINFANIFNQTKIISGITKRNIINFSPYGFSISPAGVFGEEVASKGRKYFAEYLKKEYPSIKKLIYQKQVHGVQIEIVNSDSIEGIEQEREVRDGMICFEKGIVLCVSLADCAGVLIYDPVKGMIGAIHSGWKGSSQNIAGKSIEMLKKNGSNPKDLQVWISPCASGKSYEVGYDVAKLFIDSGSVVPLSSASVKGESGGKYLFDNKKQIKNQLLSEGIKAENIEVSEICTIIDEDYHSYRRDKDKSGRMCAFIGMI